MKEIRILFFVAAFLMLLLAVKIEAEWLLFYVVGLYLIEGIFERIHERKKKSKAVFFIQDMRKTIVNYTVAFELFTASYLFKSRYCFAYFLYHIHVMADNIQNAGCVFSF